MTFREYLLGTLRYAILNDSLLSYDSTTWLNVYEGFMYLKPDTTLGQMIALREIE